MLLPIGSPFGTSQFALCGSINAARFLRVIFRQHAVDGRVIGTGIGHVAPHVGIRQFHRFDALVHLHGTNAPSGEAGVSMMLSIPSAATPWLFGGSSRSSIRGSRSKSASPIRMNSWPVVRGHGPAEFFDVFKIAAAISPL